VANVVDCVLDFIGEGGFGALFSAKNGHLWHQGCHCHISMVCFGVMVE
jgi:hypothetical protein